MSPFVLLVIGVIVLIFLRYYLRRKGQPPGPLGIPFLGIIPHLLFTNQLAQKFSRFISPFRKQYGDIISFDIGTQNFIILNSYSTIKEALIDNADVFSSRPIDHPFLKMLGAGGGIILADGYKWRDHRRFSLRVLRNFGLGKNSMEAKIIKETELIEHLIPDGESVNLADILVKGISNIICILTFGQRWAYDDDKFIDYISYVKAITQVGGVGPLLPLFYPIFAKEWIVKRIPEVQKSVGSSIALRKVIQAKLTEAKLNYNPVDEPNGYLESYLQEQHELNQVDNADHSFNDEQCVEVCLDLFLAGTDTTTNSLSWAMLLISLHPDIQTKIHQELDSVLGRERRPQMIDKKLLPYTQAVLDETMRHHPVVPMSVEKAVSHDTVFHNYNIPKSSIILSDVWGVHHDPEFWKFPDDFRPENFLTDKGEYKFSEHLISFSLGKRRCLGESLAQMELFLIFVCLMQRFRIDFDPKYNDNVEAIFEGTLGAINAPGDHQLIFHRR